VPVAPSNSTKLIMASHLREPQVPEEERMSDSDDEPDDVKERKRRERLEQNRISARESRKRKKTMIEELQRTVIGLSRDNKEMNDRNESLRRQLMELGTKVSEIPDSKKHSSNFHYLAKFARFPLH
jgi:predicted RNase H-like nuclease (RuvC/YqgF family)